MNKKNLSVVMAGAMLATSVAPVLADTTSKEYSVNDKALLANEILNLMETKKISDNGAIKESLTTSDTTIVNSDVSKLMSNGASAYGIRVLDKNGDAVDLNSVFGAASSGDTVTYSTTDAKTILTHDDLVAGYTVEVVERTTNTFEGELIPGAIPSHAPNKVKAYTDADLFNTTNVATNLENDLKLNSNSKLIKTVEYVAADSDKNLPQRIKITTEALDENGEKKVIYLKTGDKQIDPRLAYDKDNNLLDVTNPEDVQKFDHFGELVTWNPSTTVEGVTVKDTYKLIADKTNEEKYVVSDLFDGFAFTAKGSEIHADITNAKNAVDNPTDALVQLSTVDSSQSDAGIYKFTVSYYANAKDKNAGVGHESKIITVTSNKQSDIQSLHDLLSNKTLKVGVVGGDNRYETAVNVAKAQGVEKLTTANAATQKENHIVLVNGTSLVDGLSAAPLAASLKWNNGDVNTASVAQTAPVLLTDSEGLSAATKEYIEELLVDVTPANRQYVTIDLVGGESVLSPTLEKELKNMGFTVARYGGDNREETSIEVAEKMVKLSATGAIGTGAGNNDGDVFVVGANGEADAMSIAAVAASTKTPILVSSVHGLTNDITKYVKQNATDGDVTIIGGENVVTKAEEEQLAEGVSAKNAVVRLAGDTRFETNAKIIEEYYKGTAEAVIAVKDGQSNKSELVDALSAANLAAATKAPIVLASKDVKTSQKNALVKAEKSTNIQKVLQVGQGADISVLKTLADLFGVSNL